MIFTIEIINALNLSIRGVFGCGRRRRRRRCELKLCGVVADSIEIICRRLKTQLRFKHLIKHHYRSERPRQGSCGVFLGWLFNVIFNPKYFSCLSIWEISQHWYPTYSKLKTFYIHDKAISGPNVKLEGESKLNVLHWKRITFHDKAISRSNVKLEWKSKQNVLHWFSG